MYNTYKNLIGRRYSYGENDCYGLARDYYKSVFNLELLNIARPNQWWEELNLITDYLFVDGWEDVGVNLRNLKVGDGLIFTLLSGKANHVGVYVGNGHFIHHIQDRLSVEEPLVAKWMSRCLHVVRHKAVTAVLEQENSTFDLSKRSKNVLG